MFVSTSACMEKLCQHHDQRCRYAYQPTGPKIKPRVMVAMFYSNPSSMIISCYSPTNGSDETDLDAFYNELSSLVHSILKYNILIIGADMNAQIDKNVNNKFSLHNSINKIGNGLSCLNNKFKKRKKASDLYLPE